ncbi:MAG: DNRLRE domain-containing protein [Candidatus Coatesbacteria bacterium]|nr:DNRLRE domain-containing protein [Candidatus Coatesbacteria bacterium]
MLKKLPLILSLALFIPVAATYQVTLYPTDDTYTDPAGGNHGSDSELWVANYSASGHFERANLRFDLDAYAGETMVNATVHLFRFFSCPSGGTCMVDFHDITQDWSEDTWSGGHLSHSDTVWHSQGFSTAGGDQSWETIDLTDLFAAWISGSLPDNNGFVMHARAGSKFAKFYSKEYDEAYRPYVELTLSGAAVEDSSFGAIKSLGW